MAHSTQPPGFIRELRGGLILRRATPEDADALATFNADMHRDEGEEHPSAQVHSWVLDLAAGHHPTFAVGDFTIVEDPTTGAIVSSLCLISQRWTYGGVEFAVGRPELVATLPDYRRRGLVRAQFDTVHQWSAERGELMQVITGIPYYYRQFGYEMAVDLGGGAVAYPPQIPTLKEGEGEPSRIRPATVEDLPAIAELYGGLADRYCLTCVRDAAMWRYELDGRAEMNGARSAIATIETLEGAFAGYVIHSPGYVWGPTVWVSDVEVVPGIPWLQAAPCVMRYIGGMAQECAARDTTVRTPAIGFTLPPGHPMRLVIERRLVKKERPYAWYVRVPDLPAFIRHVAPVLEKRLADSPFAGHTGELKLSFYRRGLRLSFDGGRLTDSGGYVPQTGEDDSAGFPDLTFLQLLLGHRDMGELEGAFVDAWAGDEARVLLPVLFPKQPSLLWPVS